jgi:hypothetical protein
LRLRTDLLLAVILVKELGMDVPKEYERGR